MKHLVFRLYGPLSAWGEIAVGESRHSAVYPSKSALLGLLAAALGVRRDEEERQAELAAGYQFAVKVLRTGSLLRDYHTTQVPDSAGKLVYRTRREELIRGKARLGTILSSREYRCDTMALVAVRANETAPFSLDMVREKLLKPEFHLYLGRKSCPLAVPLDPVVRDWRSFGQALDEIELKSLMVDPADEQRWIPVDNQIRYYWEGEDNILKAQQILTRHDQPLSRVRWQFAQRAENLRIVKGDV
ncbi:type I-E CRISPR-associated protein Cas5/CasD [Syntrophotalea acetylenica]|jgi:CRISPR system Cascade subunit CasD|uniref:Type I-E CRISPR-associated protein Cas5/CasD n=1 Tax=Syntrophotalea acetylenica TaxID=29542 RepID=A0A1L3GHA6_SYNAC|nr:type I-E CRISPR-associated protein Cas5/CasD [Syntrophotalea acetylenica]APG25317.1 type I-E CRISPR-associated protein Cas5/CasD [Syntrophotalea acetylenica]APG43386.1 type I-E CRISPR-associated protein Cas5/CasD [Syntrophotalea acetylenica]